MYNTIIIGNYIFSLIGKSNRACISGQSIASLQFMKTNVNFIIIFS